MPTFDSYTQGTPNWVELMTPDQKAAGDFYSRIFGWEIEENPIDDEGNVYLVGWLQGRQVAGIGGQMPEMAGHPAFWGVYLAVDDVDATTAKVEAAGGKVEAGPFDVMEHGRMSAVQDPTGARVNLWQANKHIGTGIANEPGTPTWNEVTTPDPERASAFYAEVLGMGSELQDMEGGSYRVLTNAEGKVVGGATEPQMEGIPPHWNVYFNVADVDATAQQVDTHGGKTVAPPFDVPGVGRLGVFTDPQGGMFCLMAAAGDEA
jgi:predicted enzyme related to lactoylglutathione lyase